MSSEVSDHKKLALEEFNSQRWGVGGKDKGGGGNDEFSFELVSL